ncbi:MAG: RNA-guided endonuclease InsQ/TnpB family protein, partial [Leptospirillum sp.]
EMNSHRCMNRSIRDVAWSQFFFFLSYKAENAGREFRKVNPAYTSQTCSSCGHRQKMPLSCRTYVCPCCGMEKDRDHNASLNVLRLGLESRG